MQPSPEVTDILTDDIFLAEEASVGQRFVNYLIDYASFYLLLILISSVLAYTFGDSFFVMLEEVPQLVDRLFSLVLFGFYMMFVEGIMQGRSIGKFVTRTRAVTIDGYTLNWKEAAKRGFTRMVPFDTLSALNGHPWHDRWTKTMVIKVRK